MSLITSAQSAHSFQPHVHTAVHQDQQPLTGSWYNRQPPTHHSPLLLKHAILPGKLNWHICCVGQRQQLLCAASRQTYTQVQDLGTAEKPSPAAACTAAVRASVCMRPTVSAAAPGLDVCCVGRLLAEAQPTLPVPALTEAAAFTGAGLVHTMLAKYAPHILTSLPSKVSK